jgi:hypothetical protein
MKTRQHLICVVLAAFTGMSANSARAAELKIERYGLYETSLETSADYDNPYTGLDPEAELTLPDGSTRLLPLFWDDGKTWKLRVSPSATGRWMFKVRSTDPGLDGQQASFTCVPSKRRGSLQPMQSASRHFQYQNGDPLWFMGDTAWAMFTDNAKEQHDRKAAEKYVRVRASQGFNVVHSMMLSEAGWGNSGGMPFHNLSNERINPAYWQEIDRRVAYANRQGLVVGLTLAWGDKRKREPFAWRRFPNLEARKRYARYVAARYGAYDVYFLVSGEWHAEVRTRPSTESAVRKEFIEIGDALAAADINDRMIGIHPMTAQGSVREFNQADWMSFGDYQQNYPDLHGRMLESLRFSKPVVNSEYGYHLRDRDGDGRPDKDNSTSLESIRHASWDIVMAGGYLVTGFGSTYFGGNRDPGPFNVDAPQNKEWERQVRLIKQCFTGLDWWKLEPHDAWITCATPRGKDGRQLGRLAPPATTYWLLAEPGRRYLAYARGVTDELLIHLGPKGASQYRAQLLNPRSGALKQIGGKHELTDTFEWVPPTKQDWVLHLVHPSRLRVAKVRSRFH